MWASPARGWRAVSVALMRTHHSGPATVRVDVDEVLVRLRANGGRITNARRAVLTVLVHADRHLTADDVAATVRERHPEVHLSTVYRTLEALEELGVVTHVHLGHGRATYHVAGSVHHHAVCDVCGRTIELPADLLDDLATDLLRSQGFVADVHHFAFVGRCVGCH